MRLPSWIFVCLLACGDVRTDKQEETELLAALRDASVGDSSLVLSAYAVKDTLQVGDSLLVGTLIRNFGSPRSIRHEPEFFFFEVTSPSGERLQPIPGPFIEWDLGMAPTVLLSHDGIIGQVTNLNCARQPYVTDQPGSKQCRWSYPLSTPGEYEIVVSYRSISVVVEGEERLAPLDLVSNKIHAIVREKR